MVVHCKVAVYLDVSEGVDFEERCVYPWGLVGVGWCLGSDLLVGGAICAISFRRNCEEVVYSFALESCGV